MNAPLTGPLRDAGEDNELRLRRRLWSDTRALRAVRDLGLTDATIRRFRLGLREPYVSRATGDIIERALAFPVLSADWDRNGRWSYLNLDGVTSHPPHPVGWGAGGARTCWSRPATPMATLLVLPSVLDLWLVSQAVGEAFGSLLAIAPSHPGGIPSEWRDARFWRGWRQVVLGLSGRADEEDLATAIGRTCGGEVLRCAPPAGETWADLVRMGGSPTEIRRIVEGAVAWAPIQPIAAEARAGLTGDFAAEPVAIEGALVGGRMHYPVTMERREVDERCGEGAGVVQRYVVRILRSDGVLLDIERLPAPRGTPAGGRVLALSDGTRIVSEPRPGGFASWRFSSIQSFITARACGREPGRRDLARLLADVEGHLRATVWLPVEEDYAVAALFVVATFVHRVFDAFPILLVNGPKGTGKSELGQAMACLSCNGLVAGRITPAGLVRLLAESRGTVVLDDLEAIGTGRGSDDVVQILKTSYKAATARRVTPGRDGRVEVIDYFAPKVVTNIAGADAVLLSRMLAVRSGRIPAGAVLPPPVADVASLRDELHTWAMCEVGAVIAAYAPLRAAAGDRGAEIAAPLRAVAAMIADPVLAARLEKALAADAPVAAEPLETVLSRALRELVETEGVIEVAMPRLQLEVTLRAGGHHPVPSAETLGRLLLSIGARGADDRADRRRLHGEVVRIYRLASRFVETLDRPAEPAADAFAFCAGACSLCRYDAVCDATVPQLRRAKEARRIRSA